MPGDLHVRAPAEGRQPERPSPKGDRRSGSRHGGAGLVRAGILLAGIWLLGALAVVAIAHFQAQVDETRHAQVVIAQMRNEQGALIGFAFSPATGGSTAGAQTKARLKQAEGVLGASLVTLTHLGHSSAPTTLRQLTQRYYPFVARLATAVARGRSRQAALAYGVSQRPGGLDFKLAAAFTNADAAYGADAARSRKVASFGAIAAVAFLLLGFSVAFAYSVRARRRSHLDATTDALTGLGNRRKLFADLGQIVAANRQDDLTIGIFDLDRFKSYNDTFGHPAGDALLARLGDQLAQTIAGKGSAYRIGGDEFVVLATDNNVGVLHDAQAALSEHGEGFSIGCSFGATNMSAGTTPEEALHLADQRLYTNKRAAHGEATHVRSETKDALLQVLTEQDNHLATHLVHVAELAASTAIILGLPDIQVERTRLAAELHDVGKAAIPGSILNKPGPLTPAERAFIERHSEIGERIVASAPSLEAIAPIVRSAHERTDGTGYPDQLAGDQIPICSRIIAVVDAYDAMTSNRPYRKAASATAALTELRRCAGTQFDPQIVEAFSTALIERTIPTVTAA